MNHELMGVDVIANPELSKIPNLHLEHFDSAKLAVWLHETGRPDVLELKLKLLHHLQFISLAEFTHQLRLMQNAEPAVTTPYGLI